MGDGSTFVGAKCLGLLLEENLDSICGPDGDTGAKEIGVFRPYGTCQAESRGKHRPIAFVSTAQPLAGFGFKDAVKFGCDRRPGCAGILELQ